MEINEDKVFEALSNVIDFEIGIDIVSLGLIYKVDIIEKGKVKVQMTLTVPTCPLAGMITQQAKEEVLKLDGVDDVEIDLVFDPPWTPDRMKINSKNL